MNKEIENIIKKNKYRSQFYHQYKSSKKTNVPQKKKEKSVNKSSRDYKIIASFTNKILISVVLLFILLISKKDEKLNFIFKTTFKHMNFMQIGHYVEERFNGIFPKPSDENKYVSGTLIDISNSTAYKDGVKVELDLSEPVLSNVRGIVIQMYEDDEMGRVVVIQDIHGHEYHYGFLEDIKVHLYSNVSYGDILGIGKTKEDYTGSYFYLAINDDGENLDVIQIVNDED